MASLRYDRGRNRWYCKWKPGPGEPWRKVTLGSHPAPVRAGSTPRPPDDVAARFAELADLERRARLGLSAPAARPRALADYCRAHADAFAAARAPASADQCRRVVRTFLDWAKSRGLATVQAIGRPECRDYLEHRASVAGLCRDSLATERGYLSPIWGRAVEDGLIPANPWNRLPIPGRASHPAPTFWRPDEIAAIAAAARPGWQRAAIRLMANTGLRVTACSMLAWDWIDWPTLRIPRLPGTKHPYSHRLSDLAAEILTDRRAAAGDSPFAFPSPVLPGRPVHGDSLQEAVIRAIRRAKVRPGTTHDLRHSYARLLLDSGAPISVVSAQLGHSSVAVTARFYASADDRQVSERVSGFRVGE